MRFFSTTLTRIKQISIDTFKRMHLLETYLFLCMLTLLCFSNTVAVEGVNSDILIPYLNINPNFVLIGLSTIAVIASVIIDKRIKINIPLILLCAFIVYQFVSIFLLTDINQTAQYIGNYASIINAGAVFYLFSQHKIDKIALRRLLIFFISAVTLQLVCLMFVIGVPYGHSMFKYYLTLPMGSSNFIGCIIFPILIYLACSTTPKQSLIYFAWAFVLSLILKNRSGFVVLFVFFIVYVLVNKTIITKSTAIIKSFWANKKTRTVLIVCCIVALGIILPLMFKFFMGYYTTITEPGFSFLDKLTSNRTIVYEYIIDMIKGSPILGLSIKYYTLHYAAHNVVLELLCRDGVVGLFLFFSSVILCCKNRIRKKNLPLLCSIICILLQSMLEVSIFRFAVDFIFWMFLGLLYQEKKLNNPNQKRTTK